MCAKNTATWRLFLFLHICFCSRVMSDQSMKLFWIQVTETVENWWQILVILRIIHGCWTALGIYVIHEKMAAMVSILYCYYFQSLLNFCWSSFLWENSNSISLRTIFEGIEAMRIRLWPSKIGSNRYKMCLGVNIILADTQATRFLFFWQ